MVDILKVWRQIKHSTRQPTRIYLKNDPVKFLPDPIWNDGALGFFIKRRPNSNKNTKKDD